MINRRSFIKTINSAMLAAGGSFYAPALFSNSLAEQSLKQASRKIGLRYGSDSDIQFSSAPGAYGNLFVEQCSLYAANFSWKRAFPSPDANSVMWEDPNINFAKTHGLKLTGGHLLWSHPHNLPDWFTLVSAPKQSVSNYITAMANKYSNYMYSWNVVNEAINIPDKRSDGLKQSPILTKMGPSFFDYAFRQAKSAAPKVITVYNDFDMEMDNPYQEARRNALLKLLDTLASSKTPIDAVGLQSHLRLDGSRFNEQVYRNFLKEISSRGYKILITELDVFDRRTSGTDIRSRDQEVADFYKKFLSVALDEPATIALVTWGLSDKYTWINPRYDAKFIREDGQTTRPLPFDENLKPKPAFKAILNAISNAPHRI